MKELTSEYKEFVESQKKKYSEKYLSRQDELGRSGWGGSLEEWKKSRSTLLEAFDKSGRFLDVGCANGVLCRDLRFWALEDKKIELVPYGFDFVPELVVESKKNNPGFEDNFQVSEMREYEPKVQFRYIHLSFKCCRNDNDATRIFKKYFGFLEPGGTIIACSYYDNWNNKSVPNRRLISLVSLLGKDAGCEIVCCKDNPGQDFAVWLKKSHKREQYSILKA